MGPLSLILGVPLAPIRGLITLAELLHEQARRQLADPANIRRELEQVDDAVASGELSDREGARAQQQIIGQATAQPVVDDGANAHPQPEMR